MMATTHLLAGLALALPVVMLAPDLATPALVGVALGSVLPDLDLYAGHRRTLHYPQYATWAVPPAAFFAIVTAHPVLVGGAFVIFGLAVHARMDVYGGGLELRPWEGGSDRAVYDHANGHWLTPRRLVRYDGAPEDVLLAGLLAVPSLVIFEGWPSMMIVGIVVLSVLYGLIRKPLVDVGVTLVRQLPAPLLAVMPMRYLEGDRTDRR